MATEILKIDEVRSFVSDYAVNNYLIEGEEFSDPFINLCIDLAVDSYNEIPPISKVTRQSFPSKALMLYGTLWKMYEGKAALLARNTMSYSDGGVTVAIEERMELYLTLARQYSDQFKEAALKLKVHLNMEDGWGEIRSDYATFPLW